VILNIVFKIEHTSKYTYKYNFNNYQNTLNGKVVSPHPWLEGVRWE
jgi:hypothetical protein